MRTLTLKPQKQLVDLNEDLVLFDLVVSVKSKDAKEFEAVVLTQTELDNQQNLQYQKFQGAMQARLVNDKNVYQNYFLCIKSDTQQDVEVDITHNSPPPVKEEPPLIPPPEITQPPVMQPQVSPKKKSSIFSWKTLLIILAVVGIGVGLYFLWGGSGTKNVLKDACEAPSPSVNEVVGDVIPTSPVKIETAPVTAPVTATTKTASPGLMSRLKGMVDE
tara:strand:+ start:51 stop:704 length:654 start_codon:yes stop_codon:yes gene_type:complete